jgi:hypothetical protein
MKPQVKAGEDNLILTMIKKNQHQIVKNSIYKSVKVLTTK